MEQNKIKKRFYLCFVLFPLVAALLSKTFYISASLTATDIYYTGAASAFLRSVPFICKYAFIIFEQMYIAGAISAVVYAFTYFGRKTAIKSLFTSLGAFVIAEAVGIVFNLIRNMYSAGRIAASLIALASELLFTAAILVSAFIGASVILKKRLTSRKRNRAKLYSHYCAALIPTAVSLLIVLTDLTCFNVIPFLNEYDNILPKEIVNIILDYVYYIGIDFVLTYALSALILFIFVKITGKLKPKESGVLK